MNNDIDFGFNNGNDAIYFILCHNCIVFNKPLPKILPSLMIEFSRRLTAT